MVLVTRKTSQVKVVNLGNDDVGLGRVPAVTSTREESTSGGGEMQDYKIQELGANDLISESVAIKSRGSRYHGALANKPSEEDRLADRPAGSADLGRRAGPALTDADLPKQLQLDARVSTELTERPGLQQSQEPLEGSISAVRSQATAAISSLRPALRAVRKIWRSKEAVGGRIPDGHVLETNENQRGLHRGEGGEGEGAGEEGDEDEALEGGDVVLKPMSAAMTNTVYECVWVPTRKNEPRESKAKESKEEEEDHSGEKRVLVRLYGPATTMLFQREHEEAVTRAMSDLGLGPKLLASFGTGRVEEFLQAKPLTAGEMRQPETSRQIARCMRHFHALLLPGTAAGKVASCLWSRLRRWLSLAQLLHPWGVHGANPRQLGEKIHRLEAAAHRRWGEGCGEEEGKAEAEGGSEGGESGRWVGLCHMDVQHGNILQERGTGRIILIDYEYSGYAHVACDIANHFCEMAADYDRPHPHLLDYSKYPSEDEQRWFINCYLAANPTSPADACLSASETSTTRRGVPFTSSLDESVAEELMQAVDVFLPVCHLHWFLWGIISAAVSDAGFDYMSYAQQRLVEFHNYVAARGISTLPRAEGVEAFKAKEQVHLKESSLLGEKLNVAHRYTSEKSSIIVVGLSVHTAPVSMREKLAVPEAEWPRAITELCEYPHIEEAGVLSTCNRMEIYVVALSWHRGIREVTEWMSKSSGVPVEELRPHLFLLRQRDATQHLLRVSSGLDSLVLGEGQILAQVKQVFKVGQGAEGFGRNLNGLFKQAIEAGKRVRTETSIASGAVSVSSAAVELAAMKLPEAGLKEARVMIVGAGKMSRLLVKHLLSKGCNTMTVVNRSLGSVETLQSEFPDATLLYRPLPEMMQAAAEAEVVFTSTASETLLFEESNVQGLGPAGDLTNGVRHFIDISVPRNVGSCVANVQQTRVYNVDDLKEVVAANKEERRKKALEAQAIIEEELQAFDAWRDSLETVPTIKKLRQKIEGIRQAELDRILAKMGEEPTKKQKKLIEELSKGIVNKILHGPMTHLRSDGSDARTVSETLENMNALERMFDLAAEEASGRR
ncbi:unnamed protein product [Closterium sp. NIES-64]|nr:unnamed protein product [Closterium sp. NIES-64]